MIKLIHNVRKLYFTNHFIRLDYT